MSRAVDRPWPALVVSLASIMVSATLSGAVPDTCPAAPEERGVGGPRRHAEGPHGAHAASRVE